MSNAPCKRQSQLRSKIETVLKVFAQRTLICLFAFSTPSLAIAEEYYTSKKVCDRLSIAERKELHSVQMSALSHFNANDYSPYGPYVLMESKFCFSNIKSISSFKNNPLVTKCNWIILGLAHDFYRYIKKTQIDEYISAYSEMKTKLEQERDGQEIAKEIESYLADYADTRNLMAMSLEKEELDPSFFFVSKLPSRCSQVTSCSAFASVAAARYIGSLSSPPKPCEF